MIQIAIIPGDGIGPEVTNEALPFLQWAQHQGAPLTWEIFPFGAEHFLKTGETLSDEHFARIRDHFDAILFGAVGDPRIPDGRHADGLLLRFRRELQLSVNFRPCHPILDAFVPLKAIRAAEIHLEVFRENTEGLYCMQGESETDKGVDFAIHTRPAVERLLREAFQRAVKQGLPLAMAHKANVLKHGHGLWMRIFEALRQEYPSVRAQTIHADALLCELVRDPRPFGVIAADNFLGDLISDLLAGFQGGMGAAPSGSWAPHKPYRCSALFEPVHGSAPTLAGKNLANPSGMILSTALMLRYFGWSDAADAVEQAVASAFEKGALTRDLGGDLTCAGMGQAVYQQLRMTPTRTPCI